MTVTQNYSRFPVRVKTNKHVNINEQVYHMCWVLLASSMYWVIQLRA